MNSAEFETKFSSLVERFAKNKYEHDALVREGAVLMEEMAKYCDILEGIEENPPKGTPRRSADDVAEEGLQIWYPSQKQGQ